MHWSYKQRWMASRLREAVSFSPVVVVTGARQTGKSTLLRYEAPFKDWRYVTLDDLDLLSLAEKNPEELLALSDQLVIDEVQKSPGLLHAIKRAVDRNRERRFMLSGSANLLLMKSVAESLAGRALYFELLPFALGEETEKDPPEWIARLPDITPPGPVPGRVGPLESLLFRGCMPPVCFLAEEGQVAAWWRGYIRTYLERDLRDLAQVASLPDFRRLMGLLAMRNGQFLKQSEVARDAGLSQSTAGRYINLLEVSGLLVKLPPYSRNISRRMVKSPKVYFLDPGLACALAGCSTAKNLPGSMKGSLFEGLVCLNLLAVAHALGGELFSLRTQGGREREVDFLLEANGRLIGIEVKASAGAAVRDAENLRFLRELVPECAAGLVVHGGGEVVTLGKDIHAVPWTSF